MTSNISLCGADNDLSRSPWGLWDLEGAGQTRVPCRVVGVTGQRLFYSPALAAASTKVPSPRLWKRKLGPFSLSQKISEALLLRMGPTLTPRPPGRAQRLSPSGRSKAPGPRGGWGQPRRPVMRCYGDASEEAGVGGGEGRILTFQMLPGAQIWAHGSINQRGG